jgi:hypothetical protein
MTQPPGTWPPGTPVVIEADGFVGPALKALSEAKVVALGDAVDLVKELGGTTSDPMEIARLGGTALGIAREFEAYLTGSKEDQHP